MHEQILKWITENYPGLSVIVITAVLVFFITKSLMKWHYRFISVEKECTKIEDKIVPRLDNLQNMLDAVLVYLKNKDKSMDTSLFRSKSPIQLTDTGQDILVQSGGKDFIDSNLNFLIGEIQKEPIKSALDVESSAATTILYASGMDSFTKIKDYIYNGPVYRYGEGQSVKLNLSLVIDILSIYLRDLYLAKYPEIIHYTDPAP